MATARSGAKSAKTKRDKASTPPPAGGDALLAELTQAVEASLLPGDSRPGTERLREAAAFLLETARKRTPGSATIALRSGANGHRYTALAIVNDDMPFLVDSIAAALAAQGLAIDQLVHPILRVERDEAGALAGFPAFGAASHESMIYIETSRIDGRQRRELASALETTLADVRAAVADWPKMQALIARDAESLGDPEAEALLLWLGGGKLTQLGHITRRRDGRDAKPLGICRKSAKAILADASYARAFDWFDRQGAAQAPLIVKANRLSLVHRRVPLDLFIVPVVEDGKIAALSVHAGIWTSAALAAPPETVPLLRRQMAALAERLGLDPKDHDGKTLEHAFAALPHDIAIGFPDEALERVVTAMMALSDRPRPRLVLVHAALERHLFAFVWFPRDLISANVRPRVLAMLEDATRGTVIDWSLAIEGGNLAALRFVIDLRDAAQVLGEQALDARLQTMLRGWSEAVEAELGKTEDPTRAAAMATRFAEAVPAANQLDYSPPEAARDILRLRALYTANPHPAEGRAARLYRCEDDAPEHLRLKIYQLDGALALSDAVPVLENFGFRVLQELPVPLGDTGQATIHDFTLTLPAGEDAGAVMERAAAVEQAIAAVLNGEAENDVFNRLTVGAALSARDANLLRAFYRYLRQAGISYTIYTVVDALDRAPEVTRGLIALFDLRHDPAQTGDRAKLAAEAEEAIRAGLAKVEAINDDRLLRLYQAAFRAILRTNAFSPAAAEALAFKLDSAEVPGLPRPVPWREIWVYSRRVEGIHLRAGPIARGGIRWSDRRDDFRTEILGLMKAQRVKNAVIVPTGAKGGFYPKALPDPRKDRDGWAAEGQASYEVFIRALLSVTDNIVGDKVVHPKRVVVRDGDDPYFVVAADKGTASYSDIANAIAEARDFWLDDAFASGGSHGYDHKAMGITARGAWLSVQRHFLELGIDVQQDAIRTVGCGDMSGDVFGNGMLLSKTLRLVAAFDHRHIFLDPDPDPAASWKERKRMFKLPRSSWDDYDKKLISKGGGVFPRTLKTIPLSPEVRAALGTDANEMDPEKLISTILKAPVDLLWFGGIGTYVKSSAENNAAVGDPANDALRIDGNEVRAKVIGEGANLGCTQAGRIEFALKGGRNNTDFIDNSAGVDCSDNEVNIKIAFAGAKRAGKLTEKRRDEILVEMTDDVAALVLEDNRLQALSLSIAESGGAAAMPSYIRLIDMLEERGQLDRKTEGLAESDLLSRRAADGRGLTRPELAVLLSSTKLALQEAIEHSTLPGDPLLEPTLIAAFPPAMRKAFKQQILTHRLRREIVATKLANRMVNRISVIHPFELAEEEGATLDQVAAAFAAVEVLFGMDAIWQRIETAKMPETARIALFTRASAALTDHMADLLRVGRGALEPAKLAGDLGAGVKELSAAADRLLADEARGRSQSSREEFVAAGAPAAEAAMVAHLHDLDGAIGLARLAKERGTKVTLLAQAFVDLGARLGLDWAQQTAAAMSPSDPWERLLVNGLARDFQHMRLDFLQRTITGKGDPLRAVKVWAETQQAAIGEFRATVARARSAVPAAPAMLAQIASQARNLLAR
ncbi:MAG: NAD-glutamate dehydrogenase [Candidatus Andeanibacterium colombiense]|uniref:NAD-glutamate dehydrogenase n=1 Tax=Candidatus Andeanibacterium colombiense TaxID=3121345 RepID=A0AAJ5X4F3_9SPHN|nr:MAG: NAD-glutamate dehydrogenase [Sphingomonadaceae bacterium]